MLIIMQKIEHSIATGCLILKCEKVNGSKGLEGSTILLIFL